MAIYSRPRIPGGIWPATCCFGVRTCSPRCVAWNVSGTRRIQACNAELAKPCRCPATRCSYASPTRCRSRKTPHCSKSSLVLPQRVAYVSSTTAYTEIKWLSTRTRPRIHDDRGRLRWKKSAADCLRTVDKHDLRSAAILAPGKGVHAAQFGRNCQEAPVRELSAGCPSTIWPQSSKPECSRHSRLMAGSRQTRPAPVKKSRDGAGSSCSWTVADGKPAMGNRTEGRNVDGKKIRQLLKVDLLYPTWRPWH